MAPPESIGAVRPKAATWRDERGQVVDAISASTMCWSPRVFGNLRAVGEDGFSTILPCYKCPGCRELERLVLAKRLQQHFQNYDGELFIFTIKAPLEEQTRLERNLHRRRGLQLEPGFIRYGPNRVIIIARSREQLEALLNELKLAHKAEKIRRPGRRRPWARVAAGLLVARDKYGENTKRWYIRGLPPAEKRSWKIERVDRRGARAKRFDWRSAPRAWRADGAELRPPEAWSNYGHNDRPKLTVTHDAAREPEQAEQIREVRETTSAATQLPLIAAASAAPYPPVTFGERQLQREADYQERERKRNEEEQRRAELIASARALSKESVQALTRDLDNKDPPKPQIRSDEALQRAGPDGRQEWEKRELEDRAKRREADGEARPYQSSAPRLYEKKPSKAELLAEFERFANLGKKKPEQADG